MTTHSSARRRERGMALFLAILLLLVVTVMGIALMFTASLEQTLTGTENRISKVFYASDSGIEYAAGMLSNSIDYKGGVMPVGVSSFYPGSPSADLEVTIAPPVLLGWSSRPGSEKESLGDTYEGGEFVEYLYSLTSSARSTKIEASKTIEAEIGIYMKRLSIPE
jgi:hypothetical protein